MAEHQYVAVRTSHGSSAESAVGSSARELAERSLIGPGAELAIIHQPGCPEASPRSLSVRPDDPEVRRRWEALFRQDCPCGPTVVLPVTDEHRAVMPDGRHGGVRLQCGYVDERGMRCGRLVSWRGRSAQHHPLPVAYRKA